MTLALMIAHCEGLMCSKGGFPFWQQKYSTSAFIDKLVAFDLDYQGNVVSAGYMYDTVSTTSFMSYARVTNAGLQSDRWFKLFIDDYNLNPTSVDPNDGMRTMAVKFMQKYEHGGSPYTPLNVLLLTKI